MGAQPVLFPRNEEVARLRHIIDVARRAGNPPHDPDCTDCFGEGILYRETHCCSGRNAWGEVDCGCGGNKVDQEFDCPCNEPVAALVFPVLVIGEALLDEYLEFPF